MLVKLVAPLQLLEINLEKKKKKVFFNTSIICVEQLYLSLMHTTS